MELGSVRTTADVPYRFAHLQPGTYTVTVVVPDPAEQPGWSKTFGSSSVAVGVDAVCFGCSFRYKIFVRRWICLVLGRFLMRLVVRVGVGCRSGSG